MYNVAVGNDAGKALSTAVENVIVGALAAEALLTCSQNVVIGYEAMSTANGSETANELFIGLFSVYSSLRLKGYQ